VESIIILKICHVCVAYQAHINTISICHVSDVIHEISYTDTKFSNKKKHVKVTKP